MGAVCHVFKPMVVDSNICCVIEGVGDLTVTWISYPGYNGYRDFGPLGRDREIL